MIHCRVQLAGPALIAALVIGCGTPASLIEPSGEAAVRVFAVAEGLEREHKTKHAFSVYRQIEKQFPGTPEAKKAADRIRQAHRSAQKRSASSHKIRVIKPG